MNPPPPESDDGIRTARLLIWFTYIPASFLLSLAVSLWISAVNVRVFSPTSAAGKLLLFEIAPHALSGAFYMWLAWLCSPSRRIGARIAFVVYGVFMTLWILVLTVMGRSDKGLIFFYMLCGAGIVIFRVCQKGQSLTRGTDNDQAAD